MAVSLLTWTFLSSRFGTGAIGLAAGVLFVLLSTVWLAAMAVTGLDLDWIAHPDTHNGRLLASLWLALGGTLLPSLIAVSVLLSGPGWVQQLLLCLVGLVAGGFTILHNLEAHRVGILRGVLPWLGILSGIFFLVFWFGMLIGLPLLVGFGYLVGGILYSCWAIWLGVRLARRTDVPAAVT